MTFAILFLSGKVPCEKERLQISERGPLISSTAILIINVGIGQEPDALESSRLSMMSFISYGLVGDKKRIEGYGDLNSGWSYLVVGKLEFQSQD